jgi:pyridoxine kinase
VVSGLRENGLLPFYSHVLTGYVGSESFLRKIAEAVREIKAQSPGCTYVCDPVLGDNGALYVPPALVPVYKEEIVPLATVLTPNQFEAETLTGTKITDVASAVRAMDMLHDMGAETILITSSNLGRPPASGASTEPTATKEPLLLLASCPLSRVRAESSPDIRRAVEEAQAAPEGDPRRDRIRFSVSIPLLDSVFTGTGDLTSALLLAHMDANPAAFATAVERAIATVQAVCKRTMAHYAVCTHLLASAPADDSSAGTTTTSDRLRAAASSRSGQMGAVVPVFNELQLVQSKRDIENPPHVDAFRAKAL